VLALSDASESSTRLFDPRHTIFWIVGAIAAAILVGALTVPLLSDIFRMEAPDPVVIAASVILAVASGGWYAVVKRIRLLGAPRPPTPPGNVRS
jgi:hypothetical protein